jgi:hypothetical protein
MVPTILHPTLFLAQMLAREGNFPVAYLDGFQRIIDDVLDELPEPELSQAQRKEIRQTVLNIIRDARVTAGLE